MTAFAAWQRDLAALMLVGARVGACWAIVPMMARDLLSGLPRAGLIVAFSLIFVPVVRPLVADASLGELLVLAFGEACAGLFVGVAIAFIFWTVESAAALVDAQSGATAASMLNPMSGNEGGTVALLFHSAFVAYFVSIGGVAWILRILAETYRIWPAGAMLAGAPAAVPRDAVHGWLGLLDTLAAGTVTLVAPALVAMLFVELSLGLIGRIAPQLQVFFIAMPIKLLTAFFVLALQIAAVFEHGADAFTPAAEFVGRLAKGWHG